MSPFNLLNPRRVFDVPCTIEIENTFESLHAHVDLDGDVAIGPGDEVLVHGDPIRVPYGEKLTLRRNATVTKAGPLDRMITKIAARLELTELYEVSFSSGSKL
jgi:flagellar basal body rod protein FlgF